MSVARRFPVRDSEELAARAGNLLLDLRLIFVYFEDSENGCQEPAV